MKIWLYTTLLAKEVKEGSKKVYSFNSWMRKNNCITHYKMKASKKSIFDCVSEIRTVKSIGLSTNPVFEKKRLDAIELIKKYPLPKRVRNQAPQD